MIGALLVLLAVIATFVFFRAINRNDPPNPVQAVDYQQTTTFARGHARFDLVAPKTLPAGWRATSVSFTPGLNAHWHLGQLTGQDRYVGLEQGDAPVRSMLTTYVDPDPAPGKAVTIRGTTWAAWSDSGGDQALVHRQGKTTTLVVGTVPQSVLVGYVDTLR